MIKYKLTTQALTTYNDFQWEVGKLVTTSGVGKLCGPGWVHYYHSPELAVILNPIHAGIDNPRLWEVEAGGNHLDDNGLKGGCTEVRLLRELPLPKFSGEQLIEFGIRCALMVYKEESWVSWAEGWLAGKRDLTEAVAAAAAAYAYAPTAAARAAAYAAYAAYAVATRAAAAAAYAARAMAIYAKSIDFAAIIQSILSVDKE